jgi:hypothetical protein
MSARRGFAADERRSTLIGKGESAIGKDIGLKLAFTENSGLRNLKRKPTVICVLLRLSAANFFFCLSNAASRY